MNRGAHRAFALLLVACSGSAGVEERPAIGPQLVVPRRVASHRVPACDDHAWRRAVLQRDLDGAREVLERPECANDTRAVVRATIAAWSGDYDAALRVLGGAVEREPNAANREAFVALAARSGRCEEARDVAARFDEREGSGERELLLVALAPRCPIAFQGQVAVVVRRLAGQFVSESTLTMARALFDPGEPALSPAVALAVHALMTRALVPSSVEETELHLGEAARLYESVRWRGSLPSYYAAAAIAARVRLETSRLAIPAPLQPLRNEDVQQFLRNALASHGTERTFLCAPPVWVAGSGVLAQWPDLYARASLDRAGILRRLDEARHVELVDPRASPNTVGAVLSAIAPRYDREVVDAYARPLALRATLGISEAVQSELIAGIARHSDDDVGYCARNEVAADVIFARGGLRVEEQPPTNPLEWLPMLPAREMRPTHCDSCEPRPILPPRELIPPRTR